MLVLFRVVWLLLLLVAVIIVVVVVTGGAFVCVSVFRLLILLMKVLVALVLWLLWFITTFVYLWPMLSYCYRGHVVVLS